MNKHPNILFILTDDQGEWAMHCSGNEELVTPTLDRLANEGMRFENFFCVSPVCSPARASIYTGKIPSQHGVHDWLAKGHLSEDQLDDDLREKINSENPPYEYIWIKNQLKGDVAINYLKDHETFSEVLAKNGYNCGLSGKWHVGASADPQAGFSYWSTEAMGGDNYYHPVSLIDGKMRVQHGVYVTEYITDNALKFLDEQTADKPFMLAVHYTAPHSPWSEPMHPKKWIDYYDKCEFKSIPNVPPHPWCAEAKQTRAQWDSKPHPGVRFINAKYAPIEEEWQEYRKESLRGYFSAVSAMDENLGRIIDALDKKGLRENTLIVFTSDNGSNMGHHGIFGKGNGTYPQNMYDTSVKIPAIFSMKGTIPEGVVSDVMVSHYDLYQTILSMAGVPYKEDPSKPGKDFSDVLKGKTNKFRDDIVVFDEYGPVRMIRTKEWKYVHRYPDGPNELYDLVNDPAEETNLVDEPKHQDLINDMKSRLDGWFEKYVDSKLDGSKEDVRGKGQLDSHNFVK